MAKQLVVLCSFVCSVLVAGQVFKFVYAKHKCCIESNHCKCNENIPERNGHHLNDAHVVSTVCQTSRALKCLAVYVSHLYLG